MGGGPAGGGARGRTPSTHSPLQPPPAGGRRGICPHRRGPQRERFFLRNRLSGLLQPRARGASLEGLLLHGLQGRLGGGEILLDLLEGLRLL